MIRHLTNKFLTCSANKKLDRVLISGCSSHLLTSPHYSSASKVKNNPTAKEAKPSLVAKQMYDSDRAKHVKFRTDKDTHSGISTDSLRVKLKELVSDAESVSSDFDVNEDKYFNHLNELDNSDDFKEVEMFTMEEDFLLQPKPSPLLGTEDLSIPCSDIPCVGCGAHLQCHNRTLPGFLPSERFKLLTEMELKSSICQRCYYIKHCDAFMEVSTKPEEYAEMISKIRPTKSVVIMVIDLMDISGSIVPRLMDYIGNKHPLVIVGNKADLLAPDSPEYLKRVQTEIKTACTNSGLTNIKKITLVSAKTGFGIERLINMLFSFYKLRVDMFIVGTANAGKSSLFNALLASDYCKQTARDLIQRATVSVWPGTTLNLLKFPIMRPSSRTIALRHRRLKQEVAMQKEFRKMKKSRKQTTFRNQPWELREEVKLTDVRTDTQVKLDETGEAWGQEVVSYASKPDGSIRTSHHTEPVSFEVDNYSDSYWMYDTPGVINPDQILNLLTPEESTVLAPASLIVPRCVLLNPQDTLFISGLSRLDYVVGDEPLIATVHCSSTLPLKVVPSTEADQYYQQNVGTVELGLPLGDKFRLWQMPSLIGKDFWLKRQDGPFTVADIQMSSIGWVSIYPESKLEVLVRAFTPGRRGIRMRTPSLMPNFRQFKGKRVGQTAFFKTKPPSSTGIGSVVDARNTLQVTV